MITRAQKTETIAGLSDRFSRAKAAFLVDFKGINVENITKLRKQLSSLNAEMQVVRNTLAKRALKDRPSDEKALAENLVGPNAVIFAFDDVSASAKAISEFSKDVEEFVVKCGVMDGVALDQSKIKYLATLPSKDVLRAQLLGLLAAPASKFVRVLNEVPSSFVRVLNTYKETKSS